MNRPKLKTDVEKGLGKKKNMEVDEMGDLIWRVHAGRQDLGKLQTRNVKGLKGGDVDIDGHEEEDADEDADEEEESVIYRLSVLSASSLLSPP
jgi:ribosome production factor 2